VIWKIGKIDYSERMSAQSIQKRICQIRGFKDLGLDFHEVPEICTRHCLQALATSAICSPLTPPKTDNSPNGRLDEVAY